MIAHLRGKLLAKHPNQAIVETGGVGYDVTISVPTFSDLPGVGGDVALHIHTHVREDMLALYGFLRSGGKDSVRKADYRQRHRAEACDHHPERHGGRRDGQCDSRQRHCAPHPNPGNRKEDRRTHGAGIARQIACRKAGEIATMPALSAVEEDVLSALMNLGYQRAAAEKALTSVSKNGQFDTMFREALGALSK